MLLRNGKPVQFQIVHGFGFNFGIRAVHNGVVPPLQEYGQQGPGCPFGNGMPLGRGTVEIK